MTDLVERLADLTAHRDRDVLDASLVSALCESLSPASVAVHRCTAASVTRATRAGRRHDRLHRFGGEEFVLLMRCADDASAAVAFERADRALYFAKEHGRNQVRSHSALVASGDLADAPQVGDVELF